MAADAFIVSYDTKFDEIIVTFRSTYGDWRGCARDEPAALLERCSSCGTEKSPHTPATPARRWFSNFMAHQQPQKVGNTTYHLHTGEFILIWLLRDCMCVLGVPCQPAGTTVCNALLSRLFIYLLPYFAWATVQGRRRARNMEAVCAAVP